MLPISAVFHSRYSACLAPCPSRNRAPLRSSPVGRQVPIAHQRAEHHLELLIAERCGSAASTRSPAMRSPASVQPPGVRMRWFGVGRELRLAVAARLLNRELQELFGWSVVEPVHHLARHDPIGVRVVGQHLDVHLVVDDLADLLGRSRRPVGPECCN